MVNKSLCARDVGGTANTSTAGKSTANAVIESNIVLSSRFPWIWYRFLLTPSATTSEGSAQILDCQYPDAYKRSSTYRRKEHPASIAPTIS